MSWKLRIIKEKCIGCGSCAAIAPDYFKMNDEMKSSLVHPDKTDAEVEEQVLNDQQAEEVKEAVESCPVEALELVKEDE